MKRLSNDARNCWIDFLTNRNNVGHANRDLCGPDIDAHVDLCWKSAQATAERLRSDLHLVDPITILEVGSSTGLNCFALQYMYSGARVLGVEPELAAVVTANSMVGESPGERHPTFVRGFGEALPFENDSIDLIVCHTVIEHVRDVDQVISEMARVLKPGGAIHLEAPNYFWPYEPHLNVWCIPLLGKRFVKCLAELQGASDKLDFVDHLQFVTPWRLQRCFSRQGLVWENRVRRKLELVLAGDQSQVVAYKRVGRLLSGINHIGLGRLLVQLILGCGLFPSVLYTVRKPQIG